MRIVIDTKSCKDASGLKGLILLVDPVMLRAIPSE